VVDSNQTRQVDPALVILATERETTPSI